MLIISNAYYLLKIKVSIFNLDHSNGRAYCLHELYIQMQVFQETRRPFVSRYLDFGLCWRKGPISNRSAVLMQKGSEKFFLTTKWPEKRYHSEIPTNLNRITPLLMKVGAPSAFFWQQRLCTRLTRVQSASQLHWELAVCLEKDVCTKASICLKVLQKLKRQYN